MKSVDGNRMQLALAAISVVIFFILLAASLSSMDMMQEMFVKGSFYIFLLLFIVWIYHINSYLRETNFSFASFSRKRYVGALFALLATCIVFLSVEIEFKILSDETNLVSISRSLFFDKEVFNVLSGRNYYGNFNSIEGVVPKRPLAFPFFAYMVHLVFGYSYKNLFIVNFLALYATLFGAYLLSRRYLDETSSVASIFFIVSYPVVSIFATSAIYDTLFVFFFYLGFISLFLLMKKPSRYTFSLFWVNMLMLANVRHESAVYFALAFGAVVFWGYVTRELIKSSIFLILVTPLLSLPIFWQKVLSQGKWENPKDTPLFSIGHFFKHLKLFLTGQLDFAFKLPFANVLTILAAGILIYFLVEVFRKKITFPHRYQWQFLYIFFACLAVNLIIFLSHFLGDYTHPNGARFFLVFVTACAMAPVLLKSLRPGIINSKALLAAAIVAFTVYHPVAVEGELLKSLTLTREARACYKFLEETGSKNILVIADRPGQFTALEYGAVSFVYANKSHGRLLHELNRSLFADIFVFQKIEYSSGKPIHLNKLNGMYKMETLREVQITATQYLRISRVLKERGASGR